MPLRLGIFGSTVIETASAIGLLGHQTTRVSISTMETSLDVTVVDRRVVAAPLAHNT